MCNQQVNTEHGSLPSDDGTLDAIIWRPSFQQMQTNQVDEGARPDLLASSRQASAKANEPDADDNMADSKVRAIMAGLGMTCAGPRSLVVAAHMTFPGSAGSAGGSEQVNPAPDNDITCAGVPSKASISTVDTAADTAEELLTK